MNSDIRSMRERMLAGELYQADDPELATAAARARLLCEQFNAPLGATGDPATRVAILGELLGAFGDGSQIRPPFLCDFGEHIRIGARSFANWGLVCLDVAPITIGDDVLMGPNVQLLAATHPVEPGPRRDGWEAGEPITIGDNVWLGGGVIVCPGVTIGDDTVVGAGSVVVRDLPAGVVAVGNPARVVRSIGS